MRIAYVGQSYPPMISGASIVVQRLANGISKRGHAVLVITASDLGKSYMTHSTGPSVLRLRSFPNPLRTNQRFVLWSRREISAQLNHFQPDVVHLHEPLSLGLSAALASRAMTKRPVCVLTIHQLPWFVSSYLPSWMRLQQPIESLLWKYSKWFSQFMTRIVTPSETIADIVGKHLTKRPTVISNGVDLATFSPQPQSPDEAQTLRAKFDLDPDLPILLYVGRVDADKRVDLVVRATAEALHSIRAQLLVVGNGRQLPEIVKLSEDLGIRQFCHFTGYVSATSDLPGLYRLSRIFFTASEVEIQSSVVMEAAACGLPILVTNTSSMPEFVTDGVNGFLVEPRNIAAMAERIIFLLSDACLSKKFGQASLEFAHRHSLDHSLQMHEQFYQSLITNT